MELAVKLWLADLLLLAYRPLNADFRLFIIPSENCDYFEY